MLRALASLGIFAETGSRRFTLTPLGQTLRSDSLESVRATARLIRIPIMWSTWGELRDCVETGETAMMKAAGVENPFDYLKDHPEESEIFNSAMSEYSRQSAPLVAAAYDFGKFRTLVDVAGSHGMLLLTILDKYPSLRGVLFDLPHVVEGGKHAIAAAGMTDRCQTAGGDFFKEVPAGANAYIMKHIIHDWDDEHVQAILESCRRAMAPGGRVLLVEMAIAPGNEFSFGKLLDLEMLVVPGGKERTEAEYRDLFARAGLRMTGITPTPGPVQVIEAVA